MTTLRDDFISAMRQVPGAVAIIATCDNGRRAGLTATAWASVTADPPTLLVCVNRAASAHPFILSSGLFSVNLLAAHGSDVAEVFSAQRLLEGEARFSTADWDGGAHGLPILPAAVAAFECRVTHTVEHGTHTVLFGEVLAAQWRSNADALVYVGQRFASVTFPQEVT